MNLLPSPANNLILCGFMGSGKTSVGKWIAQALPELRFADTDALLEGRAGMPIPRLFTELGEPEFRARESALCVEIVTWRDCVVSTGGGIVIAPENRELLQQAGVVVCLDATVETLYKRLRHEAVARPMLSKNGTNDDPRARISALLAARQEMYASLPHHVATDGLNIATIAGRVLAIYHEALSAATSRNTESSTSSPS